MHLALRVLGMGPAPVKWSSPQRNRLCISPQYHLPELPQLNTFHCHSREFHGARRGRQGKNLTGQGDEVIASTSTFIGSVTPIVFQGGIPVFVDSDKTSWNMDTDLLAEELRVDFQNILTQRWRISSRGKICKRDLSCTLCFCISETKNVIAFSNVL